MQALVSKDCLAEYQTLNYKQAKKIKTLKSELQYLKYRLSEELYKFSATVEELKKDREDIETDFKDKLHGTPRSPVINEHLDLKNKELKNLRFLAKAALHQKSQLDNFLMESIEYCRTMAGLEEDFTAREARPGQLQKTEIRELDWEDKEKVLRVIFAKVSLGVSPSYWKQAESQKRKKSQLK